VAAHNLAANGQAHSASGVPIPRLQALENSEDLLRILGLDSDTVVRYREEPLTAGPLCGDVYVGSLLASVLDGVDQQILEQPRQLDGISRDHR